MKKTTSALLVLIIGLAAIFVQPNSINAQAPTTEIDESITLTAIPPRLGDDDSLTVKPGEKIQTSIKVRNNSSRTFTVNTIVEDFILDEDGETPITVGSEVSYRWSLKDWVVLTPEFTNLQPRQSGTVNVIIDVPEDAFPGGHYAVISHRPVGLEGDSLKDEQSEISGSAINQKVGTLLYLLVEGPINEEAFIRDFELPQFTEYGPIPFSFVIDNQSDVHIKPEISVEIYNLFGVKTDVIKLDSKNVFPMMDRNFEGQWDQVWGTGFYKAKLIASYGSSGQVAIASKSFWLLPITLIMAIVIVLLTILVVVITVKRHLTHRKESDKNKVEMLEQKVAELEKKRLEKFDE